METLYMTVLLDLKSNFMTFLLITCFDNSLCVRDDYGVKVRQNPHLTYIELRIT